MTKKLKNEISKIIFVISASYLSHSFMATVYTIFLLSRGLTLFQAALVNLCYHIAVPLLEVPTGAFADVLGRKKSLIFSNIISVFGFVLYGLSFHFVGFIAAELTLALADSFGSGCMDAHIWETIGFHVKEEGLTEEDLHKFNRETSVRLQISKRFLGAIAGSLGAILASKYIALPWFVSAGCSALVVVIVMILVKESSKPQTEFNSVFAKMEEMLRASKESIKVVRESSVLREQALIGTLLGFSLMPVFMYWAPFLKQKAGGAFWILSIVWLLIELAIVSGAALAKLFARWIDDRDIMLFGTIGIACSILILALAKNVVLALIAFLVVEAANAFTLIGQNMKTQRAIKGESEGMSLRATILSTVSMTQEIGVATSLLVAGYVSQTVGIQESWLISAIIAGVASVLLVRSKMKGVKETEVERVA